MKLKFNIDANISKKLTNEQLKKVLFRSMLKMHELATQNAPVDTGRLRNSIILKPATPGYSNYIISDGVDYGIHVEYGTSPHYVSPENLKGWARRVLNKGNLAYPVAASIAKYGTEAQPFFRPALDEVKNVWVKRFVEKEFRKNNNV